MIYICHNDFSGNSLSGPVEIPRAAILQEENGILYYKSQPVCLTASQAGKDHFARNNDGRGLERGRLTGEIVNLKPSVPVPAVPDRDEGAQEWESYWEEYRRMSARRSEKCRDYANPSGIGFTLKFYTESVPVLQEIRNYIYT